MWRRWVTPLGLLAGLLAGCHDGGKGGRATSTTRPGEASSTTASSAPLSGPGVLGAWFSGERDGWAIAEKPCSPPHPDGPACTVVSRTTDGGGSWTRLTPLDTPGPQSALGPDFVSDVRFADPQHGWAFHRSLLATFNGGKRWQPVVLGNPVVSLESSGSRVYALVGACGNGAGNCTAPMLLFEGTVSTGRWRFVTPGFDLPITDSGTILVNRTAVYAFVASYGDDPAHQVLLSRGTDDRWVRRTLPCLVGTVVSMRDKDVLVATCRTAHPADGTEVYTSSDGGRSWAVVWKQPLRGQVAGVAVITDAVFIALDNGDVLVTRDNGRTFSVAAHAGERPTVSFTDDRHGIVVAGPYPARHVLTTSDGGASWAPLKLPD